MDPSRYLQLSLIIKLLLVLIVTIVSSVGTFASMPRYFTSWRYDYAENSVAMEYGFIFLAFLSAILCVVTSILSCCGLRQKNRNNKVIPGTDIGLCVAAALLLLIAGPLLIVAPQDECNYDRVLEFERKGANDLGRLIGRMKGEESSTRVGNKTPKEKGGDGGDGNSTTTEDYYRTTGEYYGEPDYTFEEARKIFKDNCARFWSVSQKIRAGSAAIVVSLLFLLPIGLDVKQIREKPTAEQEMEEVQSGAYGAPTGEPSVVMIPVYYAAPPPQYQPQSVYYLPAPPPNGGVVFGPPVSQNYVKSSGEGGPQMTPSQNPQIGNSQTAPLEGQ